MNSHITEAEFLLIGLIALTKDVLGLLTGGIFAFVFNIPFLIVLWLWSYLRFKKFPSKKFLTIGFLESIPGISIIPGWTGYIISLWLNPPK